MEPRQTPESGRELAARIGCLVLIAALVVIAGFLGFIFTQGVRF